MHPQTIEVAAFARYVSAESLAVLLWGIKPAAANADVVTDRNRQGVNHVAVIRVVVLEDFGQQIKERSPQARVYSVQPSVEAAFRDRFWYV
jgi:hypothetical protein